MLGLCEINRQLFVIFLNYPYKFAEKQPISITQGGGAHLFQSVKNIGSITRLFLRCSPSLQRFLLRFAPQKRFSATPTYLLHKSGLSRCPHPLFSEYTNPQPVKNRKITQKKNFALFTVVYKYRNSLLKKSTTPRQSPKPQEHHEQHSVSWFSCFFPLALPKLH
jgi:hypothetical protein